MLLVSLVCEAHLMANHVSALKRNKQSEKKRRINQMNRHKLKTQFKKFEVGDLRRQGRRCPGIAARNVSA